jgi:hypothetical protein
LFSHGYRNTIFDRAVTFTNWLREQYSTVRLFREVDREMTAEFLGEKAETCTPDTVRTLLATLKKLQEGLHAMNWIREDIVPVEWQVIGGNPPRGPYVPDEAKALQQWVEARHLEYGQALRFILSSGARIDALDVARIVVGVVHRTAAHPARWSTWALTAAELKVSSMYASRPITIVTSVPICRLVHQRYLACCCPRQMAGVVCHGVSVANEKARRVNGRAFDSFSGM